ncbi:MAG: nucleotidyltransferase domain-containing protein [Saprospiraceae bacterium]
MSQIERIEASVFHRNTIYKIRKIKPLGSFFPQDKNGFILNDTSFEKVPNQWLPVIEKIKKSYLDHFEKKVHSIYLRGSVARGNNVDGFSDIDIFAVIDDLEERWKMAVWQPDLQKELQVAFPFVREVEIMMTPYFEDFFQKNPRLAMIIKTQSLCIFGNDLSETIPPFLPNEKMSINLIWLEEDVNNFLQKEKITQRDCQEITKILIRSGFELVMEKEQKFTTDLYLCYSVFSKYFPKKENEMREILHLYLNPIEDQVYLKKSIGNLGNWMLDMMMFFQKKA